jgi:virulence-associated protein VagC
MPDSQNRFLEPTAGRSARARSAGLTGWYILVYAMKTAKLFRNGRSQAVRLPKEFRFAGDEVVVRRSGKRVILEPKARRGWPAGYWESWRKVPADFGVPDPLPGGGRPVDFDS